MSDWDRAVKRFLKHKEMQNRARKTILEYRRVLLLFKRFLMEKKQHLDPRKVKGEWVVEFLKRHENSPQNMKHYSSQINCFLKFNENFKYEKMGYALPRVVRKNVDWLSIEEADKVISACRNSEEKLAVHLALYLMLRRSEIMRLRVQDIKTSPGRRGFLNVLGKGQGGGKWRNVPFSSDTERLMLEFLEEREEIVSKIHKAGKEVPENLFIYYSRGHVGAYKHTSFEKISARISERAGVKWSWHTLRRTGGRIAHLSGVDLVVISEIMGHADTRTTKNYLGINNDDMSNAMDKMSDFIKTKTSRDSIKKGGT